MSNPVYADCYTLIGKEAAIIEAEKPGLDTNHFYHALLGHLYSSINDAKALQHFKQAKRLAGSVADKEMIQRSIDQLPTS